MASGHGFIISMNGDGMSSLVRIRREFNTSILPVGPCFQGLYFGHVDSHDLYSWGAIHPHLVGVGPRSPLLGPAVDSFWSPLPPLLMDFVGGLEAFTSYPNGRPILSEVEIGFQL